VEKIVDYYPASRNLLLRADCGKNKILIVCV
jgi:hypothetical protein